jgi:hypothetical protein
MTQVAAAQAYVVLLVFPLVVVALFRKLPLQHALIWSIVSGYLILPSSDVVFIDLPVVPALDKNFLPAVVAAIMCYSLMRKAARTERHSVARGGKPRVPSNVLPGWLPRSYLGIILIVMMMIGAIASVLTNGDRLIYGDTSLPGQRPYDAMAGVLGAFVIILPLLLGRKFLSDDAGHMNLLKIVCVAALAYSLLAVIEIRLSPQLNRLVYGFFPHEWVQHIRPGGFRPVVFLDHGLKLGIFFAVALVATGILMRSSKSGQRLGYALAMVYLLAVLFLSNNLGAMLIAMALVGVVIFFPIRLQLTSATVIAAIVLTYPILRGADLAPTETVVNLADRIDSDRAGSLQFRFDNEDILLEKANERPLFGWGQWGRWRVFDEDGTNVAVSDGEWVITIGEFGWFGYIARFGLFCFPIIALALARRRHALGLATTGVVLMVSANLIDLLPNSDPSPIIWLAAGALMGRLEAKSQTSSDLDDVAETQAPARRARARPAPPQDQPEGALSSAAPTSRYSRFAHQHTRSALGPRGSRNG